MNILIILTLFVTISGCLSIPTHHDGGFTVDLIHRDSPLSPLYNSTYSLTDRLQNAFIRSMSRSFHLSKRLGFASKSLVADIVGVPGEYIMKIKIGTPGVEVFGVADTGSDLTWAQCQPCRNCYKQDGPLLDPSTSSTYKGQSCQSKVCEALEGDTLVCTSRNICQYKMTYGDRSYSIGDLSRDTFWFGRTSIKNVVYGCGHDNKGLFNEKISGIVGLGGGRLSIVNQLNPVIKGKFSYCLIPQFSEGVSNQTSKIHFGDGVDVSGPDAVSTPLVQKEPSTYFYLTLENVSVGNKYLPYKQSSLTRSRVNEEGNIIIDSGTTLTYLPRELYSDFIRSLSDAIGGETVQDPDGFFELCYRDLNLDSVPTVTFGFEGADVVIPTDNMFFQVKEGVTCLTIVASDGLAIFGNLSQANLLVGYDLVDQTVSFKPTDCTQVQH